MPKTAKNIKKLQGGFSARKTPYVLSGGHQPKESHRNNADLGDIHRLGEKLNSFFPENVTMARMGVDDDGSCYYHSLACGLNFDEYHNTAKPKRIAHGHTLRKMFEESVTPTTWLNYWNGQGVSTKQVPDLKMIKKQMSKTKTWANVYSIMFTMHMLNLNLVVFDQTSGEIYCGTHNPSNMDNTIFICWIQHSHFEPILQVSTDGLLGMFPKHDPIVKHVIEKYNQQGCPRVSLRDILKNLRRKRRSSRRRRRSKNRRAK